MKEGSPEHELLDSLKMAPLQLANALAACVMSARLSSHHRQWAAQVLVKSLASQSCNVSREHHLMSGSHDPTHTNIADLVGDMPRCPVSKLEAHQNRVNACVYNSRKALLATSALVIIC